MNRVGERMCTPESGRKEAIAALLRGIMESNARDVDGDRRRRVKTRKFMHARERDRGRDTGRGRDRDREL